MITTNAIQRTFHIKIGESTGTCFTVDVDGRQYLVTAKHVVENLNGACSIEIYHEKQWKSIDVTVVGHCDKGIDISVLTANFQISPTHQLEPTSAGLVYGQDVYFLGFPYGMSGELGEINSDFPLPFVKRALVSNMIFENDTHICFLDGHNNPGFSGVPVVFKEPGKQDYKVCSVISGYRYAKEPIYQGDNPVPLELRANTGIVITYGIQHAVDLIKSNPIGYALKV